MNAILVCRSTSHGNTAKIARAIADVLDAQVVDPADVDPLRVGEYDLVGFGSGIYGMSFDRQLRKFAASMPHVDDKPAFIFATAGSGRIIEFPVRPRLRTLLEGAGYRVLGAFCCPGYDTWMPLRLIGGLNKGRPNEADVDRARAFGEQIRTLTSDHDGSTLGAMTRCPACGDRGLHAVTDGEMTNFLCERCGRCWHVEMGYVSRVDPVTCPGCPFKDDCLARWAADPEWRPRDRASTSPDTKRER